MRYFPVSKPRPNRKRKKKVSKAETILALAREFANLKGYVRGLDTMSIAKKTGFTTHDTTKTLFDLQKRGLLGFSENKKSGRDGNVLLYRLRLTKQGLDTLGIPENGKEPEKVNVPGWPSQEEIHEHVLEGHPEYDTEAGPTTQQVADSHGPDTPPNNELASADAVTVTPPLPPPPPGIDRTKMTPYSTPLPQEPPRARYPTIVTLLDRKRLAEDAARNLEALGADSLALKALALTDSPLTPFQKDVAKFFADHPNFVRFALEEE